MSLFCCPFEETERVCPLLSQIHESRFFRPRAWKHQLHVSDLPGRSKTIETTPRPGPAPPRVRIGIFLCGVEEGRRDGREKKGGKRCVSVLAPACSLWEHRREAKIRRTPSSVDCNQPVSVCLGDVFWKGSVAIGAFRSWLAWVAVVGTWKMPPPSKRWLGGPCRESGDEEKIWGRWRTCRETAARKPWRGGSILNRLSTDLIDGSILGGEWTDRCRCRSAGWVVQVLAAAACSSTSQEKGHREHGCPVEPIPTSPPSTMGPTTRSERARFVCLSTPPHTAQWHPIVKR